MFKCKHCDREFEKFESMKKHIGRIHKIHASQTYVDYFLNGIWPICKCGCGKKLKYQADKDAHFLNYVAGHQAKGQNNPMFGKHHKQEAKDAISNKRKEKFTSGEIKIWCEGLSIETDERLQSAAKKTSENKERAQKISDALTGRKHTPEHNANSRAGIIKAWEGPELREAAADRAIDRLLDKSYKMNTGIELKLKTLLDSLNIEYDFQKSIGHKLFDFVIESKKIIIEADGDFFHCNPIKWPDGPKYETQREVIENDQTKNEIAEKLGYKLIRFWESDINNNTTVITEQLQQILS